MSPPRVDFRQVITTVIIGGYFVAYFLDPTNDTFKGALVAQFAAAAGYWLGSSQGAHENRAELNEAHRKLTDKIGPSA